jgi:hypothetical protein
LCCCCIASILLTESLPLLKAVVVLFIYKCCKQIVYSKADPSLLLQHTYPVCNPFL